MRSGVLPHCHKFPQLESESDKDKDNDNDNEAVVSLVTRPNSTLFVVRDSFGGKMKVELHTVYPSNNRFWCGGKVVSSPDWIFFAIAAAATVIPQIIFLTAV